MYTGQKKVAVIGLFIGLIVSSGVFFLTTDFSDAIVLTTILIFEKQLITLAIAYFVILKQVMLNFLVDIYPLEWGEKIVTEKIYENFDKIDASARSFLWEYFLILLATILISRFILNFLADNVFNCDLNSTGVEE